MDDGVTNEGYFMEFQASWGYFMVNFRIFRGTAGGSQLP